MPAAAPGLMTEPERGPGARPADDLHPLWYVAALVAYVVLGYLLGSVVLNWIVGPLFLVAVLEVVPRAVGRLR